MLFSELLDDFDAFLTEEGHAKTTRSLYRWSVSQIMRELGPAARVNQHFTPTAVRAFVAKYEKAHRPASVQSLLNGLRSFAAWCEAEGYLALNPLKKIKNPPKDGSRRPIPTPEKVVELLKAHERVANPYRAALGRALVAVFAGGGLRCADALNLQRADVNLQNGSLYVRQGKGNKSRTVYLPPMAVEALQSYLAMRPGVTHPFFFSSLGERPLTRTVLYSTMSEMATAAGFRGDPSLRPHSLRHAYATYLLGQTGDLSAISKMLGHASSAITTAVYDHPGEERLKAVAALAERKAVPLTPPTRNESFRRFAITRGR